MQKVMNSLKIMGLALAVPVAQIVAPAAASAQVNVLATVGMVSDIVAEIGADCADVAALIEAGVDPHDFQPSASDVRKLQSADVILHVGFGLEGRLGAILARLGETRTVLAVAESVAEANDLIFEDAAQGVVDPHLWMDVALWSKIVPVVATTLAQAAPDCAPEIDSRATQLTVALAALDGWVSDSIATIPEGQRVLVTAHDAFSYFARAYGLDAAEGIEGISTESEASIADIRSVADIVVRLQVPAVFIETTVNPRTIEALVAEVRALGHDVTVGGALYSDALGEAGTADGTYIGMIRANTITIVEALGGNPLPLPEELGNWATKWGLAN